MVPLGSFKFKQDVKVICWPNKIHLPTNFKMVMFSQSVKDLLDSFWLRATAFSSVLPPLHWQRSKALGSDRVFLSLYTCNELRSCSDINYLPCALAALLNWIKTKWNGPILGDDVMQRCTAGKRPLFLINILLFIAVLFFMCATWASGALHHGLR